MSRRLPAALVAVALAAAALLLAGCGGDDSAEAVATTDTVATTTPVGPAATQGRSFVVYAKPTRAQFINHADDRERGDIKNPFDPDTAANTSERQLREEGSPGRRQRALQPQAVFRPQPHASRRHRDLLLHVQLRPGSDLRGQLHAQRRNHDRDGPSDLDGSTIVLPVTGGTGRYAGAHGQLTSTSSGNKKNTQIIRFRLV